MGAGVDEGGIITDTKKIKMEHNGSMYFIMLFDTDIFHRVNQHSLQTNILKTLNLII